MRYLALMCVVAGSISGARPASAQDPTPPIPRYVIDLHATAPMFPSDLQQLADSRGELPPLTLTELPGWGVGAQAGVHLYVFTWKALTVGVGGEVMVARARGTPPASTGTVALRAVDERVVSASPQLSFNFGTGHGWSYLSAGVGRSQWSLHPSSEPTGPADAEVLPVFNYGGGARWFIKRHLAFSFDIRLYDVAPGSSFNGNPGSPRARVVTIGAGVSVK
jgi:hypothetical protein